MITHTTHDHTSIADNGKTTGQIRYHFHSPTHWSTVCEVVVDYNPYRPNPEVHLQYGAGGCNKGYTDAQIALAMSQTFAEAAVLLASLEHQ